MEFFKESFTISTEKTKLDINVIHHFLANDSYWAKNIPLSVVCKSIENSLCFGVYTGKEQIGFARVITDYAIVAYLADVFILDAYRGKGLGKWLVECIVNYPDLQGLRVWKLTTRDAHGLYAKFGFKPLGRPEYQMEIIKPDVYTRP